MRHHPALKLLADPTQRLPIALDDSEDEHEANMEVEVVGGVAGPEASGGAAAPKPRRES
jgi:hypothetical protein